jgi:type IV fimbrial biogenesis protein FimT
LRLIDSAGCGAMSGKATPYRKAGGFTLLELILTLSVAALLLSIGVPSFRALMMNSRMIAQTNEFITSVKMARSAAVRYQRDATICLSSDYDAAVPTCDAGTDWSAGWIVWVDKNRDSATAADEILAVHEPLDGSTTLTSTATNRFVFDARGFAQVAGDNVTLCDSRTGETGRVIKVNNAGRTNVSEFTCT